MREQINGIIQEARSARTRGQAADALRGYLDAAVLARSAGDNALLAHALRHVSALHLEGGSSEAAFVAGDEATAILGAAPAPESLDLANAIRVTALSLEALGRPVEAAARWTQARELYAALDVVEGVSECDHHLGRSP